MLKRLVTVVLVSLTLPVLADTNTILEHNRPDDFVDVKQLIPQIQVDIRYYSNHNFVGRKINGYEEASVY